MCMRSYIITYFLLDSFHPLAKLHALAKLLLTICLLLLAFVWHWHRLTWRSFERHIKANCAIFRSTRASVQTCIHTVMISPQVYISHLSCSDIPLSSAQHEKNGQALIVIEPVDTSLLIAATSLPLAWSRVYWGPGEGQGVVGWSYQLGFPWLIAGLSKNISCLSMCLRHYLFFLFFTKKECDVLFEGLNVLAISVPEALAKEWDKGLLEQKSYFEKKEKKHLTLEACPFHSCVIQL